VSDVANWDAWGGDDGIQHVNAVCPQCTPEDAIAQVMERARLKYRGEQDWARWAFRVEQYGYHGPVIQLSSG
jgi:hypothetical protein